MKLNLYDINWNSISKHLIYPKGNFIPKPNSFDEMLDACVKLGKDIPFVRIDFYDIDGKLYFGEMTFTIGYIFTKEYYEYLAEKLQ